MPKRLDKQYPCLYCGKLTRKRTHRGTVARCADCGSAAMREANRRMSELARALRVQSGRSG